jgi:hypothetical protein
VPVVAEAVNGLVTVVPSVWEDKETPPVIPFSTRATRALELLTAASVGRAMGASTLTSLNLNPSVFKEWEAEAHELVRQERLSIIRLKRSNNVNWVQEWAC